MRVIGFLALLIYGGAVPGTRTLTPPSPSYFPLDVGRYWVYRGPTRWTEGTGWVRTAVITWRMEVVDAARRGIVRAALLKGHPSDLARYQPGKRPGDYVMVQIGAAQYHLLTDDVARKAFETRKRADADRRGVFEGTTVSRALACAEGARVSLEGIVSEGSLYLDTPLVEGKVYGELQALPRARYCYAVAARHPFAGRTVKGLRPSLTGQAYVVYFRTSPDHSITEFVPGVGITAYTYVHHGTTSETRLRLVETGVRRAGGRAQRLVP